MRTVRIALSTIIAALLLAIGLPADAAAATFTLDKAEYTAGTPVTAAYTTDRPDDQNWVGIYSDPGNAPVNGTYVGPSTAWTYAPGASGTVTLPTTSLSPGAYVAYFLYNDGYTSLAAPVRFTVVGAGSQPPAFLADPTPLRNARVDAAYRAKIVAIDPDGTKPSYRKVSGPSWARIAADGTVSGTPRGTDVGVSQVVVSATDGEGLTARATATITVRPLGQKLVPEPVVTAFNVWHSGSQVTDGVTKQLRFLVSSGSDVVGLSESRGTHAKSMADALGWYSVHNGGDLAIISKYPLGATFTAEAGFGARVEFAAGERAVIWDVHLNYTPYGPYDACFDKMSVDQIIARESQSGRVREIDSVLRALAPHKAEGIPVFLVGDFNAPSHRDWTPAAASLHCGYTVNWPVSQAVERAGLVDSYRVVNPDPVAVPGNTWSPVYPRHNGSTGVVEPQDRIDFVYSVGPVQALSSSAVVRGNPAAVPDHKGNEWASDHAAVVTRFRM